MSISYNLNGKYGIGKQVIMSKQDYDRLNGKKLCVLKAGYVMIWDDGKTQYFHRWVFGLESGNRNENHVDHISGDKLDCRRENLRVGTRSDNMCNIKKAKVKNVTSKYKGVNYEKGKKQYLAKITKNRVVYQLGYFDSEVEAAEAYNKKAKELHKDYAVLNIIPKQ